MWSFVPPSETPQPLEPNVALQVIDRTIEWQKLAATLEEVNRIRVHDVLNETYDPCP